MIYEISALGELGGATGGLQAVLHIILWSKTLDLQGFSGVSPKVAPYFNSKKGASNRIKITV